MSNESEILLKDGRFIRREFNDRDLGSQEAMLRELMQEIKTTRPYSFPVKTVLPSTVSHKDPIEYETPVHCLFNKNSRTYGLEVPYYPINCDFWDWGKGLLTPFKDEHYEEEYEREFKGRMEWKIVDSQSTVKHWFLVDIDNEERYNVTCIFYTTLQRGDRIKSFIPSVPNLHDDGVICMGTIAHGNTDMELVANAVEIFMSAGCNHDLRFTNENCLFDESGELKLADGSSGSAWSHYDTGPSEYYHLNRAVLVDFHEHIVKGSICPGTVDTCMTEA